MNLAPDPILHAVLYTVHNAAVSARNWTIRDDICREQINELMEAVHELPQMVRRWENHSLDEIVTHLRCFDAAKWRARIDSDLYSVPDLVEVFQRRLAEHHVDDG